MTDRTALIGDKIARAAQSYGALVDAVARLDAAKNLHPKESHLRAIGGEVADHAEMYIFDRYLASLDTLNAWINSQASMMRRVAETLEKAKP